jgi:hypothetical protein
VQQQAERDGADRERDEDDTLTRRSMHVAASRSSSKPTARARDVLQLRPEDDVAPEDDVIQ